MLNQPKKAKDRVITKQAQHMEPKKNILGTNTMSKHQTKSLS